MEGTMIETIDIERLKPHPRNYNEHPQDQVEQIAASLTQHGQYRNVVIAKDDTILAGHGVVLAAIHLKWDMIEAHRLDIDPESKQAIKLLAADNTLAHFGMTDDRALSELLKEIREFDEYGLDGTGYDDMMLANYLMITRPASEIGDTDEAAEWLGMPDFEPKKTDPRLVVLFRNKEDREQFAKEVGFETGSKERATWSTWWPKREQEDLSSVKYEVDDAE